MTDNIKSIVITGANSPLGSATVKQLLATTNHAVVGVVSPWSSDNHGLPDSERLTIIVADLTKPFSDELSRTLSNAGRILHFAWVRSKVLSDAISLNRQIILAMAEAVSQPDRIAFISSVGASASAKSVYGRAKWTLSEEVLKLKGCVLVCGLVQCEPPQGPYKLLEDTVRKLPISLRFFAPSVPVFLTPLNLLMGALKIFSENSIEPDIYRLYSSTPRDINEFLKIIESENPRIRVPLPIFTNVVTSLLRLLNVLKLGVYPLGDKVLTFLIKDKTSLISFRLLPGLKIED